MIAIDEMIGVVHTYYPRGMARNASGYASSEEHRRLVDARRKAGAENGLWRAFLRRLGEQFPEASVLNASLHLPTGNFDAAYSGKIVLSSTLTLGFLVSFLMPYYVLHSARVVEDLQARPVSLGRTRAVFKGNTCYLLPTWAAKLATLFLGAKEAPLTDDSPPQRIDVRFDFSPEEQPYATWISGEIGTTWGFERMPPEVGRTIVPDVATDLCLLGEATLYDCLFADDWLR